MFNSTQQSSTAPNSDEKNYIIQQNKLLQGDCKQLRDELMAQQKKSTEEINELQRQSDEFEADLDKAETSLRYLRNLQQTLASLHLESDEIAKDYRKFTGEIEKFYTSQIQKTNYFMYMVMASYVMTVMMALGQSPYSNCVFCSVLTIGVILYGGYWHFFKDNSRKVKDFHIYNKNKKNSLSQKTREYNDTVKTLPGIEELIDNA